MATSRTGRHVGIAPAFRRAWTWLLPLLVVAVIRYRPDSVRLGSKVLVAVGVVALVSRRPKPALLVLMALLPFQQVALAAAYRAGVPAQIVRDLGFWKEAVVAGCLVAAARGVRRPLDAIDLLSGAYLAIVGLYFLFPHLFVHPTGPLAVGPPTASTTLMTAVRNDTVFVFLLLAVRRMRFDARFRRRFVNTLLVVGALVAGIGMFEFAFSNAWNHLIVSTLRAPRYLATVLNVSVHNPADIRVYTHVAGRNVLRIGSVFLDQLSCGLYLVVALGIALERLARGDKRLAVFATSGLIGVAILLTQTRAAIVAVVIVIACTLRPSIDRRGPGRARYTFLVAAGLVAVIPLALATGLASRASGTIGGGDQSSKLHVDRTAAGIRSMIAKPLGRGLGTGATNGTRFQVSTTLTSENYYLQVGNETGAGSMAVFIALVVVANVRLRQLALRRSDILMASWRGVFLGLSVAALFLQVWLDLALAWTVWAGLGVCLGMGRDPAGERAGGPASSRRDDDLPTWLPAAARRWPLVVVTVAAALLATQSGLPRHRTFTARSTVVVGLPEFMVPPRPGAPDPSSALIAGLDRQRQVYAAALAQLPLATEAVLRTGVARAPGRVVAETRTFAPPALQLLRIRVTDPDPAVARLLADGLAESLIARAPALQQPNATTAAFSVSLSGPAALPLAPDPDGSSKTLTESAILGLLAAIAAAVLSENLDKCVTDAHHLERRLGVPVLPVSPAVAPALVGDRAARR